MIEVSRTYFHEDNLNLLGLMGTSNSDVATRLQSRRDFERSSDMFCLFVVHAIFLLCNITMHKPARF